MKAQVISVRRWVALLVIVVGDLCAGCGEDEERQEGDVDAKGRFDEADGDEERA